MQLLGNLIFLYMKKNIVLWRRYDLLIYASLVISYSLFAVDLCLHYCSSWYLQVGFILGYSLVISLIEARLFTLVF